MVCNGNHTYNELCTDPKCHLGKKNPYLRLQIRLDVTIDELRQIRRSMEKILVRAGEPL